MSDEIKQAGAGPFSVGDRVRVPRFQMDGTVTEVGETQVVRVFASVEPDELRAVTPYFIEFDNGVERSVMDRDGLIVRL